MDAFLFACPSNPSTSSGTPKTAYDLNAATASSKESVNVNDLENPNNWNTSITFD